MHTTSQRIRRGVRIQTDILLCCLWNPSVPLKALLPSLPPSLPPFTDQATHPQVCFRIQAAFLRAQYWRQRPNQSSLLPSSPVQASPRLRIVSSSKSFFFFSTARSLHRLQRPRNYDFFSSTNPQYYVLQVPNLPACRIRPADAATQQKKQRFKKPCDNTRRRKKNQPASPPQKKGKEKGSLISQHFTKLVLISKITARQKKNWISEKAASASDYLGECTHQPPKPHKRHRARAARHERPSAARPPVDRSVRCVDGRFGKKLK